MSESPTCDRCGWKLEYEAQTHSYELCQLNILRDMRYQMVTLIDTLTWRNSK